MSFSEVLATLSGYLIGLGSLLLYTPIAIRVVRQKHADGLVLSTWWLKTMSYLCSDIYFVRRHYVLSTYAETLIITIEAGVVLFLVAYYQKQIYSIYPFWILFVILMSVSIYGFTTAPLSLTAVGQLCAAFINIIALLPQFYYNYSNKSKGDYSPVTAALASLGCFTRIFTTRVLNNSDPVLLLSFISAFVVNTLLLLQILYYGIYSEGLTFKEVCTSDINTEHNNTSTSNNSSTNYIVPNNNDGLVVREGNNCNSSSERIDLQLASPQDSNCNNTVTDDNVNDQRSTTVRRSRSSSRELGT